MELVDRNEVLRQMQNSRTDCPYDGQQAGAWKVAHDCCISIVESIDAIEAEPVRHGRWIKDKDGFHHCSECGENTDRQEDAFGYDVSEFKTLYCGNCGAKMDLKLPEETEKGESPC